jgi:multimeric flavodoxin WrbA
MALTAVALNCSLKARGDAPSSTDAMIALIARAFARHDVAVAEPVRVVERDIKAGVTSDEGEGDAWPALRRDILAADILIIGTPIWLGQMSSLAKRVLERMDAFLGETDEAARMPSFGKVAVGAIVGNEDGAHAITANLFQAPNDVGWTIPAGGACYWVGEAMQKKDFKDLASVPDVIRQTADTLASNAAHLARLLRADPYPGTP